MSLVTHEQIGTPMFKNYFSTAFRNLEKNRSYALINITGLSVGMAVALLIGLWIWDELSFDRCHQHNDHIAQVMQKLTFNGNVMTGGAIPLPLEAEMQKSYGSDLKYIVMSSWADKHILSFGDKNVSLPGTFMGKQAPDLFSLRMIRGTRSALNDRSSILLSASAAKALFGDADALNKIVKLDNKTGFRVTGVFEDPPVNTTFHSLDITFIAPWDYYVSNIDANTLTNWGDDAWQMYVQVQDNVSMTSLSEKMKSIKAKNAPGQARFKPEIFLQPMKKWHLYGEFKNGVNTGGAIRYVWLFGITGLFVLLLACINFMNLSTARSEKRAKEVGLRKAIGSSRSQLIAQFYCESVLMATLACAVSLVLVFLSIPWFNAVADKQLTMAWDQPVFWTACILFTLLTGLLAGSYPALYLSSFRPVKVLKGTFGAGRFAAAPRKVLVVLQFTVSVLLITGTIVVFKQVQFAKNRPVGYSRQGLLTIELTNNDLHDHFEAVRNDLLKSGAIMEIAESSSPATGIDNYRDDVSWPGKDPSRTADFANIRVTNGYGMAVGWHFLQGRDFSRQLLTDSGALVINEAAVKYMGLKDPVGQVIKVGRRNLAVIGVIKDMVMQSPYEPVTQTIFYLQSSGFGYVNLRINPAIGVHEALAKIETVCKAYSPSVPFSFKFADDDYAKKFSNEVRVGNLAGFFAALAIFISCLGLFGMAAFTAEQRIREIGIRKVLGASILNLWGLLSKDFVMLVMIALFIAAPLSYALMTNWLQHYEYHTDISWWIFAVAAAGALLITLVTVSFQSVKAALTNPAKTLKAE